MLNITSLLTLMSVPIALKLIDELSRSKQKTNKKRVMFWAALHHFIFGILLAVTVWF